MTIAQILSKLGSKADPKSVLPTTIKGGNIYTSRGKDGTTPHIGENGNWYIGDVDTGVRAEGLDGAACTIQRQYLDRYGNVVLEFSDKTVVTIPKGAKGDSLVVTSQRYDEHGNLVLTFSDGTTSLIPKGEDYILTPTDKQDIADLVVVRVPTKVSQLENDSHFISQEVDPSVPQHVKNITAQQIANWDMDLIDDESVAPDKVWSAEKVNLIRQRVSEIEDSKTPNVIMVGEPTIDGSQMSDFSVDGYAMFPFLVSLTKPFEINFAFTTGAGVTSQQNILDSDFGLAFAIRSGKFVIALSTTGTNWDLGEGVGTMNVLPNTSYLVKLSWDGSKYELAYSLNMGETYVTDIVKQSTSPLAPKQMYIGVGEDGGVVMNVFGGIIDFRHASLSIGGNIAWLGFDDIGLLTRMATDLSNIDSSGISKLKDLSPVKDVQISGSTIVENGVVNILTASGLRYGVVKTDNSFGLTTTHDGVISVNMASDFRITERANKYYPIVPANLDYAVRAAMCDGKGAAWTDEEKLAARLRMYGMANTPSGDPLHHMYVLRGAEYHEDTNTWSYQWLSGLTTEEVRTSYMFSPYLGGSVQFLGYFARRNIRFMFPYTSTGGLGMSANYGFYNNKSEQITISYAAAPMLALGTYLFFGCSNLKYIQPEGNLLVNGSVPATSAFTNCPMLEYVRLQGLIGSLSLQDSPNFRADCVAYAVNNARTGNIVITLHPDAYARAIADADVQAALQAHTNVTLQSA